MLRDNLVFDETCAGTSIGSNTSNNAAESVFRIMAQMIPEDELEVTIVADNFPGDQTVFFTADTEVMNYKRYTMFVETV